MDLYSFRVLQVLEEHELSCLALLEVGTDGVVLTKRSKYPRGLFLVSVYMFSLLILAQNYSDMIH